MGFVRSLDAFRKECEGRDKTGVFAVTTLWRNLKIEARDGAGRSARIGRN